MRTTLEIDDRALAAARAKAAREGTSLGRAVSDMILNPPMTIELADDFPTFPTVPGHVITEELVDEFRDE